MSTVGSWFGSQSSRDNGRGHAITNTYGDQLSGNLGYWQNTQNGLNAQNSQIGGTNYWGGAQDAYQNQVANYQQQNNAASMLYNQATGAAPSAADLQMQAGLGNANNQVQSAALSQQGGVSPGLSQRNMLNAQAAQNAQIVSAGQAARANELNNAQNNYTSALGQMAGTAQNMTDTQNTLANQRYGQAQNQLNYATSANQQGLSNWNTYSANVLNAQEADIDANYKAQLQQNQNFGNTVSSAAGLAMMI